MPLHNPPGHAKGKAAITAMESAGVKPFHPNRAKTLMAPDLA
jgi:hypothetical protein